jgi:hypothetical protein
MGQAAPPFAKKDLKLTVNYNVKRPASPLSPYPGSAPGNEAYRCITGNGNCCLGVGILCISGCDLASTSPTT